MIKENDLKSLKTFWIGEDGHYCDGWEFSIIPRNLKRTDWDLYDFNEVNGNVKFIKQLKDIEDLYETYYLLTLKELE